MQNDQSKNGQPVSVGSTGGSALRASPARERNDQFEACIERKLMKDGTHEIHCKLGLWSVSGCDRSQIEAEAEHYWWQYYWDGEYASLLPNAQGDTRPPTT